MKTMKSIGIGLALTMAVCCLSTSSTAWANAPHKNTSTHPMTDFLMRNDSVVPTMNRTHAMAVEDQTGRLDPEVERELARHGVYPRGMEPKKPAQRYVDPHHPAPNRPPKGPPKPHVHSGVKTGHVWHAPATTSTPTPNK